ncbi:MAG: SpoIIE family protein phosphatase [Nannocystaceae bacterium]
MRFRAAILATTISLVVGIVGASVIIVGATIERSARASTRADLERSAAVFVELAGYRASLYAAQVQVVAAEPRLRAVVHTDDIDHATVLDSARELQASARADLFVLTDGAGRLSVDTAAPEAEGFDLSGVPTIAPALAEGAADGIWIADARAYQVHAERLTLGAEVIGALALGFALDDRVAATIERQTGAQVLLILEGAPIAASSMRSIPGGKEALAAALAGADAGARTVELDGATFMIDRAPFPTSRADQRLEVAVVYSLDEALAAARAVVRTLLAIAGVGLLLALGLALLLARRLARPVDRLVDFTRTIAGGALRPEASLEEGPTELAALGAAMNRMVGELAESRALLRDRHRLEDEMEIANRIQTSILPSDLAVPGLEIGAKMLPATEVGGDYYDVIAQPDGAWIGVGDVAGHGLRAGLVMLMVQSSVASLVRERPSAAPRDLVATLNATIADNVRRRLHQDEHVTFSLLRYYASGRLVYAGAHEPFLVIRADTEGCEEMPTPGTWIGVLDDISFALVDSELTLQPGDLVILYTDGLIEAHDAAGVEFGIERVREIAGRLRDAPCEAIARALVDAAVAWRASIEDDVSAVVMRYRGGRATA